MTALKEYARLESMGVWRESPATQRRDVVVSFGESTLVISDRGDRPLAHWSLAAVDRANPGKMPAVYRPGLDAAESLEIDDETMVAAIEKVRALIARRRPQRGRLRLWLVGTVLAALGALLVFWVPGALLGYTVSVLPPAARQEIGASLLTSVMRISGLPCTSDRGAAALDALERRLLGPGGGRIIVLPGGVRSTAHLPGGAILVNRSLVEDHETPDVLAGYVLAEDLRRHQHDPVERLLRSVGVLATARLLTTGALPAEALAAEAEALLLAPPEPVPDEALIDKFAQAHVPVAPYAWAIDVTGESTLPLIEADPFAMGGAEPVLTDAEWVSLQSICGE